MLPTDRVSIRLPILSHSTILTPFWLCSSRTHEYFNYVTIIISANRKRFVWIEGVKKWLVQVSIRRKTHTKIIKSLFNINRIQFKTHNIPSSKNTWTTFNKYEYINTTKNAAWAGTREENWMADEMRIIQSHYIILSAGNTQTIHYSHYSVIIHHYNVYQRYDCLRTERAVCSAYEIKNKTK